MPDNNLPEAAADDNAKPSSPSRRRAIQALLALPAGAAMFGAYRGCTPTSDPLIEGPRFEPFSTYKEILAALETSPDNLTARKKALVKNGSLEEMLAFVRDDIALVPNTTRGTYWHASGETTQEPRIVLRDGMGTFRDKAELLKEIYTEAGYEAQVRVEQVQFTDAEFFEFILRTKSPQFAPEIGDTQLRQWTAQVPWATEGDVSDVIADESALEWAKRLYEPLGLDESLLRPANLRMPKWVPVVQFSDTVVSSNLNPNDAGSEGKQKQIRFAHLLDPNVPFGQLKSNDTGTRGSRYIERGNTVEISVKGVRDDGSSKYVELLTHKFDARVLAGRQLNLSFLKEVTADSAFNTTIAELRTFTPVLTLQDVNIGPGDDLSLIEENSVVGNTYTMEGDHINLADDTVGVNGNALLIGQQSADASEVATVVIDSVSYRAPLTKITARALDAQGNDISGLQPNDFKLTDNDHPVFGLMERNQERPNIVVLHDVSLSMPSRYRGANMTQLMAEFQSRLLENFPSANLRVQSTGSNLWTWLTRASSNPTNDLIVYFTDGHNSDSEEGVDTDLIANGAPVIMVDVRGYDDPTVLESVARMAELGNGSAIRATEPTQVLDEIGRFISDLRISPYVFTYRSPAELKQRTAALSVNSQSASQDYLAPLSGESASMLSFTGISLHITLHRSRETIVRVLAGRSIRESASKTVSDNHNDVLSLVHGGSTLYFEANGPTTAAAYSDFLRAKLSQETWLKHREDGNMALAQKSFKKGFNSLDFRDIELMRGLDTPISKDAITFASTLRVAISTLKAPIENIAAQRLFDYMPFANFISIGPEPVKAYKQNVHKTLQLSVRELALFPNSALNDLQNTDLKRVIPSAHSSEARKAGDDFSFQYWRNVRRSTRSNPFFGGDFRQHSFIMVDDWSGQTYGILPEQIGGGREDLEQTKKSLQELMTVADYYITLAGVLGAVNGVGGGALGAVAKYYGLHLAKLYFFATEALIIMAVPRPVDDVIGEFEQGINGVLQDFAMDAAIEGSLMGMGKPGEIMGGIKTLIALMGSNQTPPPLP